VLEEGFGWPASEPDVDEAVRAALGAHGEPVSIPLHRNGIDIWVGIAMEGAYETMIRGHGGGTNTRAWSDPEMVRTLAGAPRLVASPSATLMVLSGALASRAGSAHYAVARRLAGRLARAYDEALERFDVLALPTNPMKPPPLPAPNDPLETRITRSTEPIVNTCPFNVTGHPALSAPWARVDGLPVGVMLVGRRNGERDLLRAAASLEPAMNYCQK
jgi:amidase